MIEPIKKEHLHKCLEIMKAGYENTAIQFGMTEENCPYRGRTRLPFRVFEDEYNSGYLMYAYVCGSELAGFLSMHVKGHKMYINDIVVLPVYQNNGFGSMLMRFAREQAKQRNCDAIILGMVYENIPLRNWYKKQGFKTVGLKKYEKVKYTVATMELLLSL